MVSAGALVILVRAVVEDALHETHAGGVIDQVLCRAQAFLVAHPTGGQSPGQGTLLALAFPTGFTQQKVLVQLQRSGSLQVHGLAVHRLGLDPDCSRGRRGGGRGGLLHHWGWHHVIQEPLIG